MAYYIIYALLNSNRPLGSEQAKVGEELCPNFSRGAVELRGKLFEAFFLLLSHSFCPAERGDECRVLVMYVL